MFFFFLILRIFLLARLSFSNSFATHHLYIQGLWPHENDTQSSSICSKYNISKIDYILNKKWYNQTALPRDPFCGPETFKWTIKNKSCVPDYGEPNEFDENIHLLHGDEPFTYFIVKQTEQNSLRFLAQLFKFKNLCFKNLLHNDFNVKEIPIPSLSEQNIKIINDTAKKHLSSCICTYVTLTEKEMNKLIYDPYDGQNHPIYKLLKNDLCLIPISSKVYKAFPHFQYGKTRLKFAFGKTTDIGISFHKIAELYYMTVGEGLIAEGSSLFQRIQEEDEKYGNPLFLSHVRTYFSCTGDLKRFLFSKNDKFDAELRLVLLEADKN